jgi:hypothetical protein
MGGSAAFGVFKGRKSQPRLRDKTPAPEERRPQDGDHRNRPTQAPSTMIDGGALCGEKSDRLRRPSAGVESNQLDGVCALGRFD